MSSQILPMNVGDMFERTFFLIGKTFVRNVIIAAIFLIIPVILLMIAADYFYSSIADLVSSGGGLAGTGQTGFDLFTSMLGPIAMFCIALLFLGLGSLLAEMTIMFTVGKELTGESVSFSEAIRETFYAKWLYGIGQGLLKFLAIIGGSVVIGIFIAVVSAAVDSAAITGLLIGLCVIVGLPLVVLVYMRWYFSLTAVAIEELTPMDSLRQSWFLVKGLWWRTFGILILLSILSQFVISIVSLPLQFGSMWSFYRDLFTAIGKTGGDLTPEMLRTTMKGMGPGIGIGTGITSILSLMIAPVYTVVMYFDLRARKNDLPESLTPAPISPPPPSPQDQQNLPPEIIQ